MLGRRNKNRVKLYAAKTTDNEGRDARSYDKSAAADRSNYEVG